MRRHPKQVVLTLAFALGAFQASAQLGPYGSEWISGNVHLTFEIFEVKSAGEVLYECVHCLESGNIASGQHRIFDGGTGIVATQDFGGMLTWEYKETVSAGSVYEHCYNAKLDATGKFGGSNGWGSATKCAPPAPNDPPVEGGIDDGCIDCQNSETRRGSSPILIALSPGGISLSGPDEAVAFDIDADGTDDRITWTRGGDRTAFLARDINRNGVIDNGSELFGDSTRLSSGAVARNGYEALRQLDDNLDGWVDVDDEGWRDLLLWVDLNHNGFSEAHELSRIDTSDVSRLHTVYHWTGRRDQYGNTYRFQSSAKLGRSSSPTYDVWFNRPQ